MIGMVHLHLIFDYLKYLQIIFVKFVYEAVAIFFCPDTTVPLPRDICVGSKDFIICGFSTVAYEALFSGVNPIRAIEPNSPQYFDANDRIPLAENYRDLSFLIQNFKLKNRLFLSNFIKKEYFYRLDRKSKIRFWKALK